VASVVIILNRPRTAPAVPEQAGQPLTEDAVTR
jgi:hypothetical protein